MLPLWRWRSGVRPTILSMTCCVMETGTERVTFKRSHSERREDTWYQCVSSQQPLRPGKQKWSLSLPLLLYCHSITTSSVLFHRETIVASQIQESKKEKHLVKCWTQIRKIQVLWESLLAYVIFFILLDVTPPDKTDKSDEYLLLIFRITTLKEISRHWR